MDDVTRQVGCTAVRYIDVEATAQIDAFFSYNTQLPHSLIAKHENTSQQNSSLSRRLRSHAPPPPPQNPLLPHSRRQNPPSQPPHPPTLPPHQHRSTQQSLAQPPSPPHCRPYRHAQLPSPPLEPTRSFSGLRHEHFKLTEDGALSCASGTE